VTLFLAGDVMTGRGVDQALPRPGDPRLYESYVTAATEYLTLAEQANGPIPKPVDFAYIWGDALTELERRRPDVRLVNLETAVTRSLKPTPKGINYKMNPANLPVLTIAAIDCCVLANNHVLDWGHDGLIETLATLAKADIKVAGAGRDRQAARAPAVLPAAGKGRVLVFAFGSPTSGIPADWAATENKPGVNLVSDLSPRTVWHLAPDVREIKKPGDVVVASIHWGPNWGYDISDQQVAFAHALIDEAGVDVVHGHSSHHAKAIEVYGGRLILYGCGDFLNDYEGIKGYEAFRDDLAVMYLPAVRALDGTLDRLTMVPFQIRRFRLNHAVPADAEWLAETLSREGERFKTSVHPGADGTLMLVWD
jgi:poly-gamma-glutamate synthesis protein (capsule biosynthesis protein)